MLIAIPSKGRAGVTKSDKLLTTATLFVPESELHQYQAVTDGPIVAIPNNVKGITPTRNWILKNSKERYVVFVDDDLDKQGWTKHYKDHTRIKPLTQDEWLIEFARLFNMLEELGWKVWGVKTEGSPKSSYPYKPINFRSYVTASCMGMINDGSMLFDENYTVKEDYEITLRHLEKYGGILTARYLFWQNSHWVDDGGCKDYRTQAIEAKAIQDLAKQYPGRIRQITKGGSNYSIELNL